MSDTKGRDRPVEVQITPEMIAAGVEALATWKQEDDYISERQAVIEIYLAMQEAAKAVIPKT